MGGAVILVLFVPALLLVGCGGGEETKSQVQVLEERSDEVHADLLLVEAELVAARFWEAQQEGQPANTRYERRLVGEARALAKACLNEFGLVERSKEQAIDEVADELSQVMKGQ
jgi:hypothetical protein